MAISEEAFVAFDPAKLRIDHADYAGLSTDVEKRRAIKTILDNCDFAIPTESISPQKISALIDGPFSAVESRAQMEGIVWVKCHYDATANTGIIKTGYPVCINMVKGNCVTGVNASWGNDEYKMVGFALKDYSSTSSDGGQIPVRLAKQKVEEAEITESYFILNEDLEATDLSAYALYSSSSPGMAKAEAAMYVPSDRGTTGSPKIRLAGLSNPDEDPELPATSYYDVYNPTPFKLFSLASTSSWKQRLYRATKINGFWVLDDPSLKFRSIFTGGFGTSSGSSVTVDAPMGLVYDFGEVAEATSGAAKIVCPIQEMLFKMTVHGYMTVSYPLKGVGSPNTNLTLGFIFNLSSGTAVGNQPMLDLQMPVMKDHDDGDVYYGATFLNGTGRVEFNSTSFVRFSKDDTFTASGSANIINSGITLSFMLELEPLFTR